MNVEVKRLDHLGIIVGIIKDLGIINYFDQRLKSDVRNEVTIGESVAAMIINGLGFTTKPLSLTSEFFEDKPLDLLFGKDIQSEYFNRSKLGRVLDSIFDYGFSKDYRSDLKQVVQGSLVSQDGGIPLAMRTWSGNASYNEIFK